jgi:hypothetical protein
LKLLVTFATIGAAFDFQKAMEGKPLSCEIIPSPRCLGVSCLYAAMIEYQADIDVMALLKNNLIEYSIIYQIVINDKGHEVYEEYKEGE